MKILIIEDDQSVAELERDYLEINGGFQCDLYTDGTQGLQAALAGDYALGIVDVMLPGLSGFEICRRLREVKDTPVIIISALADDIDKVRGLGLGADDYMTKPFSAQELLARIRAMTRVSRGMDTNRLTMGNVMLDLTTYELSTPTGSFRLTGKEFQMMEMLLSNQRRLIPTERFLEKIWGYDTDAEVHVVWVYISYLRKKLASLGATVQIRVARNAGYSLEEIP